MRGRHATSHAHGAGPHSMGYAEIPAQMWAGVSPVPVQMCADGALERSVSCARIVDAVRVFSAGRIFSQNLPPTVVEYPGVPPSTLQQQAGECSKSRRRCGRGEPSPGAGVAQASTVPALMWHGRG